MLAGYRLPMPSDKDQEVNGNSHDIGLQFILFAILDIRMEIFPIPNDLTLWVKTFDNY